MVLPLTLATFRGTFVEVEGQPFIIPSAAVERVGRAGRDQITEEADKTFITLAGLSAPFVRLPDVLEIPVLDKGGGLLLVYVLLRDAAGRRVAFAVDKVLMEDEVLVKPFLKPLLRVRHLAGAAVLGSGKVVPVLNVGDIMKTAAYTITRRPPPQPRGPSVPVRRKRVLVVEDSIISRMLFKSILESAGYAVKTAVDGEEAWDALQSADYDVVVSDIEMPRLDGFGLTSRIRGDPRVADKPVILITGRSAPEDRVRGMEAGANAYIVKSSFDQSDLLEALRRVL
jgi:two-component system chemotaxis sensor kinase CheA